ncbi:MAG: DUF4229 domain-containing protein [Rhodoluna sp.]|mgnify:FL=1
MKNPWVKYLVLRIGTFSAFLAVFLLLQFDPFYAAAIAAILALAISLIFFGKQRDAVSAAIYRARNKKNDSDTDAEDSADDQADDRADDSRS